MAQLSLGTSVLLGAQGCPGGTSLGQNLLAPPPQRRCGQGSLLTDRSGWRACFAATLQFNVFSLRISLYVNTVLATLGRYIILLPSKS